MNARAAAAKIAAEVLLQGRSLGTALNDHLAKVSPPRDRALTQELCFGVLRWQPRLAWLLGRLLTRPLRRKDRDLEVLMLLGLYQLSFMRIPTHAAVAETVSATRSLDKPWAGGLVNGVLRNFVRRRTELEGKADGVETARWAHPPWLIEAIAASWPEHWQAILAANNRHPPLSLRVNRLKARRADYMERLRAEGLRARPIAHTDQGIIVTPPVDPVALPGFADGWCSVQDGAAQLAAPLAAVRPGDRVLDACCAPGGKTTHLLELHPDARVLALDKDPQRLEMVRANLRRLGLQAETLVADAAEPRQWWDGQPFDRILVDAPCSASGVIRRHPDIKILRRSEDVAVLAQTQGRLLDTLWPLLRSGGLLLYTTCSVLASENQDRVKAFLDAHPQARADALAGPWGLALDQGRQVLPGDDDMDGFYFARLVKHEDPAFRRRPSRQEGAGDAVPSRGGMTRPCRT